MDALPPNTIPLFPLNSTLHPGRELNMQIFEIRYLDMIRQCIADGSEFGVVPLLRGSEVRSPQNDEVLGAVGTMARIEEWHAPMPSLILLRCVGTTRFRLTSYEQVKYGLWVGRAEPLPDA